jgi:hypothetical protein
MKKSKCPLHVDCFNCKLLGVDDDDDVLFVCSGWFGIAVSFGESVVLSQSCLQLGKKISFCLDSELEVCSRRDFCFVEFCRDSFGIDNFILESLSKTALVKVCSFSVVN